jgi:hypothetical protein
MSNSGAVGNVNAASQGKVAISYGGVAYAQPGQMVVSQAVPASASTSMHPASSYAQTTQMSSQSVPQGKLLTTNGQSTQNAHTVQTIQSAQSSINPSTAVPTKKNMVTPIMTYTDYPSDDQSQTYS